MAPLNLSGNYPGFWDPITSTLDWCEKNYEINYYVAEFWNTLSNFTFIIQPLMAYYRLHRLKLPFLYYCPLFYLSFVGMGSLFFHMTLKYEMQLWDELAMMGEALLLCFIQIKIMSPEKAERIITKAALIAVGLITCGIYIILNQPVIFQICFASVHYFIVYLGYRLTRLYSCSPKLFWSSIFFNHFAFLLWNVDNNFCGGLENIRTQIPSLLIPVTQLHAVWHVLAGFATLSFSFFVIHVHLLRTNRFHYIHFDLLSGWKFVPAREMASKNGENSQMTSKTS
ncbi:alkaline ceramidase [Brevipalpus obovatus]|uniref:alkaline ceramidase n=1 Tax=Brevipalpus obovatus TaxID=246614 RepID=UPI003D9E61BF